MDVPTHMKYSSVVTLDTVCIGSLMATFNGLYTLDV